MSNKEPMKSSSAQDLISLEAAFTELMAPWPEAVFLVRTTGEIIIASAAATNLTGRLSHELSGETIQNLVIDPSEKVVTYLRACANSKLLTPGSLTWLGQHSQEIFAHCEGALLRPKSPDLDDVLLLRVDFEAHSSQQVEEPDQQSAVLDTAYQAQAEREKLIGQLEALNQATQRITHELAFERALQNITDEARTLLKVKYAALGIHDGQGNISQFLTSGISEEVHAKIGALPTGKGVLGYLLHHGQSIIVDDISRHANAVGFPNHHPLMNQLLGVPIYAHGTLIGALYLTDKADGTPFTEIDQYLIDLLAHHAANAIANAQLFEQSQRVAVLEERDHFAQDLHDGIIQSIYGVGLALDQVKRDIPATNETAIEQIDLSLKSLSNIIQELRSYIFDLRPQAMEHRELKTRLEALFQELENNLRLSVQANISPKLDTMITEEQARHIFHICHEALSNAARHAKANKLFVSLTEKDSLVTLRVEDDGIGFKRPPKINPGHRGLANIQARATRLGALLNIESQPQQGTRVILTFRSATSTV